METSFSSLLKLPTVPTTRTNARNVVARPQRKIKHFIPQKHPFSTILSAHGHGHGATATSDGPTTFMDELRSYAMRLHTKEQAPREGQAPSKEKQEWKPTKEGYFRFLIESKEVYNAFEDIIANYPIDAYRAFSNTGLERSTALSKDIAYMSERWNLTASPASPDGPGLKYANTLRKLAMESPPAFMCHYYNYYFAHTAGGRMIGSQVSKAALEEWTGEFYKWDGDVRQLLGNVRESLNTVAEGWSREEKDACLEETPATFKSSGELLRLIGTSH